MAEIEITRKDESFILDVESIEDAKVILSLLATDRQRKRVMAEIRAFFDKRTSSPPTA